MLSWTFKAQAYSMKLAIMWVSLQVSWAVRQSFVLGAAHVDLALQKGIVVLLTNAGHLHVGMLNNQKLSCQMTPSMPSLTTYRVMSAGVPQWRCQPVIAYQS